jgi:glycosyltransferase involved in cell wall biosynthesis
VRGARPESIVAYLSERADLFGGGQRSLCDLVRALRGAPVRPLVVVPGPGALAESLDACGVDRVSIPLPPLHAAAGWGALTAIGRLRRLILERGVDLVHSDSPRTALYGGIAARITRRRHVFHLRASRASSSAADRVLVALSDRVVAVSRAVASRSRALRTSPKIRVVPTGLHPIDFLPRHEARSRLDLPRDAFVLGMVGRVEEDKGREEALVSLASVRRAAPGALLVFVGPVDPEDTWTRTLSLRAASFGLAGAVRLAGPQAEAARLLKAFDVLVHPSRHEALPRVVLEAQFAEVPVVATAVGGVPEIIDSGRNGLLVSPRDPEALGRAAASLALDPGTGRRLARAGLQRARERFGIGRMVTEILGIYAEVLPAPPAAAAPGPSRRAAGGRATEATP